MCNSVYQTIGYSRDDGAIDLLVTLNNSGGHLTEENFRRLNHLVLAFIAECSEIGPDLVALDRQDTPDVITPD